MGFRGRAFRGVFGTLDGKTLDGRELFGFGFGGARMPYLNLYCDESGVHRKSGFYFGALRCSPVRAETIHSRLNMVREKYGLWGEMKYEKVSKRMLPGYLAFSDEFFNDPFSRFAIASINCSADWKRWAPTRDERIFKAYYVFLRRIMIRSYRYNLYFDDRPGKSYRWRSLYFAINRAAERDGYHISSKFARTASPLNSRKEDLIQLADVILGAATSMADSLPKNTLANHVRSRSSELTRSGYPKIAFETLLLPTKFRRGTYGMTA